MRERAEPRTLTFVLDGWLTAGGSGTAPGFNLDDFDSIDDLLSSDGSRLGVDNALRRYQRLAGELGGDSLEAKVGFEAREGRFLVVVEVTDVDDLTNADDVGVRLFEVTTEEARSPPVRAGTGRFFANQRFQTMRPITDEVRGDLFGGVVRARFSSVSLPLVLVDPTPLNPDAPEANRLPLIFLLEDAEPRITLGPTGIEADLGGSDALSDLTDVIVLESGSEAAVLRDVILPMLVDLGCDPMLLEGYTRISMGYEFTGVSAVGP